jgi:hypothetical protein
VSSKHGERFAALAVKPAKVHKSMTVYARHESTSCGKDPITSEKEGKAFGQEV